MENSALLLKEQIDSLQKENARLRKTNDHLRRLLSEANQAGHLMWDNIASSMQREVAESGK